MSLLLLDRDTYELLDITRLDRYMILSGLPFCTWRRSFSKSGIEFFHAHSPHSIPLLILRTPVLDFQFKYTGSLPEGRVLGN